MIRDDLLRQIHQPLLDRVDRRLAAILAVSIGAHLAIAIAAWLSDPPAGRAWLQDDPQYVFTEDMIEDLAMTPVAPEPGAGAPIAAKPAAPAAPATKPRSHRPGTPRTINPTAVIGDLLRDDGAIFDESRRQVGKNLGEQLEAAGKRQARVGKPGEEQRPGIVDGDGPDVDAIDGPSGPGKSAEKLPPPPEVIQDPVGPTEYDPSRAIAGHMRALQRCYQAELGHNPSLAGRVDLRFTITTDGHVTGPRATGLAGVAACVEARARGWKFPVELKHEATYSIALIFVRH